MTNPKLKPQNQGFTIPHELMKEASLIPAKEISVGVGSDVIVVQNRYKTASEILRTITDLEEVCGDLAVRLASVCEPCMSCYSCLDCGDYYEEALELIPESVFNVLLDSEICIPSLLELLEGEDVI